MAAFEELGLLPELGQATEEFGWLLPTDIQAEAIPLILGGGDVLMAAETGSGKTGAFCLPLLQIIVENMRGKAPTQNDDDNWKLNPYDSSTGLSIDQTGLICENRTQRWLGCRSNKAILRNSNNIFYFEVHITTETGVVRVGWSLKNANYELGCDALGFGFGGTGKKSNNRQFDDYGESFTIGDTVCCYLDLYQNVISFSKNGKYLGPAFSIPHVQGPFYPAICIKNAGIIVNFGEQPFKYPNVVSNSIPLSKANADCISYQKTNQPRSHKRLNGPMAIVIEPSRELAEQTYKNICVFKKFIKEPINDVLVVGGIDSQQQISKIQNGLEIIVATPGRIEEFINSNIVSLERCQILIIDEIDGLIINGQTPFLTSLHSKINHALPVGTRLQMIVCSATLHNFDVKKLADSIMHFPIWIDLKGQDNVPETIHHVVVTVDPRLDKLWHNIKRPIQTDGIHSHDRVGPNFNTQESFSEAVKILKGEYVLRAINEHKMDKAMIFCRTKLDCDNLCTFLNNRLGANNCICLHSDIPPAQRKSNFEAFKANKFKFLICTDVAARGLDITGLPYVINVTLPDEKSNYLHRIGRSGRVDRMGLAISFVSAVPEKVWFHKCPSRGKNCRNTNLITQGGCTIWYNEIQCLADIEEHLGVTIQQIDPDIKIPVNEFDGKVTYGAKRVEKGSGYETHLALVAPKAQKLYMLEKAAQDHFLLYKF